jgi:DNA gyrase subunit B
LATDTSKKTSRATNKNHSYDASDIKVLEGLEAVRKRPAMYIGSTGPKGLHHLIWEVVDNAVDEAMAGEATRIEVTLQTDGGVRVRDNGRGIPVDKHKKTKQSALTTVLTTLHSGGKFEQGAYTVSGGLHGVGVSVVNALSTNLIAEVVRDGSLWMQEFDGGKPVAPLKKVKAAKRTGTTITFWADPDIFTETVEYQQNVVITRLREMAFLNKGLEIVFEDERPESEHKETFKYTGGLVDFVKHLNSTREPLHPRVLDFESVGEDAELELAMQWTTGYTETVLTFANNINTHEGGTHEEGLRRALTRAINDFAKARNLLKDKDDTLQGEDIREGITAVLSVRVRHPQFEGQTKTKLGNTEIRSFVEVALNKAIPEWLERNPGEGRKIVEKCITAMNARKAAREARELTRRKSLLESSSLPGKLADCSSRDPEESELFIVEGNSAAGPAKEARDSRTQAILPIRGKILNTEKARLTKTLQNNEIQSIITAVGTGIGDEFELNGARYHKIVILTDADVDGAHIRSLLLTFFFRHMRNLIEAGYVYVAEPPLYRIQHGKKTVYLKDDAALAEYKKKVKGEVRPNRFKGLGEMNPDQLWETSMDPATRRLFQVEMEDAARAEEIFSTLMGDNVDGRRAFIQQNAKDVRFLDI